ncbi:MULTISPECIES: PLP-dependent cysteine synthase family protein [unclassified Mycolicibacterium]|uniref:PLP-dependent cysteine synthase family protein n=1 Tax=unclassified Mycolicibacterium TaxID=2636767 RepID=UPI0035CA278F
MRSLPAGCARVLLKLEQYNPTGTAKIRMARQMVDDAEAEGKLQPGGWLVESTSGNTGIGLALIAAERGYRFTAIVDGHSSDDKLRAMQAYGAELITVGNPEGGLATDERDRKAQEIAREHGAYWTKQHRNPSNPDGYRGLADELRDALGDGIDYLFGAVGTGGSLCGTGRILRKCNPQLKVIGVEPEGSIMFGGEGAPYHQQGTGTPAGSDTGDVVDYDLIDEGLKVHDAAAFETSRHLARQHGILVGGSAGGVIYRAVQRARTLAADTTLVVLVCDGGEKYLDTVFNDDWMAAHHLRDPRIAEELHQLIPRATR